MFRRMISLPELGLFGGTRAALGAGIALLLADRLSDERRRAVGWTLLAVGAVTTIPLAALVMSRHETGEPNDPGGGHMRASAGSVASEHEPALRGF